MRSHFSGLRQFWTAVFILALLSGSVCQAGKLKLSPAEQTWLDAHPVIRMSVDVDYGPYTFLNANGELQGVAVEFFSDIKRLLGIRFEIVSDLSWTQQMEAVRERRLDAVATAVKLPERETFLKFTEIYLPTPLVIMTRSKTPQLQSLNELQQLSLSLVKGYSSSKQLTAQFPGLRPRYVSTPLEGLRLVASGVTDAYVGVLGINNFLAARNGITNLKVNAAFNMADNGQRFAVRKDWPQLAWLLDKALAAISAERKNVIFQRWLPRDASRINRLSRPGYVTRLFPWLISGLGLALLCYFVLFVFHRRLQKAVKVQTQKLRTEITERKQTEEALCESENRYKGLFEESPVSLWEEDFSAIKIYLDHLKKSGISDFRSYFISHPEEILTCAKRVKIIDVNRATLKMFKAESKEVLLENLDTVFGKKSYDAFTNELIYLAEGKYNFELQTVNQTLQGNEIQILLDLTIVPGHEDTWSKVFVSLADITQRMQTETELTEYRYHLEALVEKRTEELQEKKDKIEKSSTALTYLLEDVNASRTDLEKANQDLGAVNKELQEFAYIVSHDLKAPLRAISQLSHWISEDYSEAFDDDGKMKMDLIIKRAKRMDGLIDGILRYSRVGRVREKEERVDLNILVTDVINNIAPPGHIKITIENELPVVLRDSIRLEQVFQNLIGNAVKYMDKDKGFVKVDCADEGEYWECSVSDNGPGIDKKYHDRIFQIFQTLTPRDSYESTGIGLTLVKKIISLYGGSVRVASEVGKGSTFVFTIPKK